MKLSKREGEVCRRLGQARKMLGLSQSFVSEKIGIPRDRLASYEGLRAPLKWFYGFLFCAEFKVSIAWLAIGKGTLKSEDLPMKMPIDYTLDIPDKLSFAAAYDKFLAPAIAAEFIKDAPAKGGSSPKSSREVLRQVAAFWNRTVTDEDVTGFVRFIWRVGEDYRRKRDSERLRLLYQLDKSKNETDPEVLFGISGQD